MLNNSIFKFKEIYIILLLIIVQFALYFLSLQSVYASCANSGGTCEGCTISGNPSYYGQYGFICSNSTDTQYVDYGGPLSDPYACPSTYFCPNNYNVGYVACCLPALTPTPTPTPVPSGTSPCYNAGGTCCSTISPTSFNSCSKNKTYSSLSCNDPTGIYQCYIPNTPTPIPPPQCNTGVQCGSCGGAPGNTCYNGNGNQGCTYTQYTGGGTCTQVSFNQTCTINNCNAGQGYTCNAGTCQTNITVHAYTDYNHTASNNGGGKSGVNVNNNGNWQTTDSNGNIIYGGLGIGNYTISENVPANFQATNATSQGVTLTNNVGNATVNFYLTPLYFISGTVYYDANHDLKYDTGDSTYGSGTITITGGPTKVSPIAVNANGTWTTPTNLESGNYTVTYSSSSLPSGYSMTTSNVWYVTVGNPAGSPACSTGGLSLDASCGGTNNGSILNLNFGINYPYQISGYVYNDVNKNYIYDNPPDQPMASQTISVTGPTNTTISTDNTGYYTTGQILLPGKYTVTDTTPLPSGYTYQILNTFIVTVGYNPACSTGGNPDATCGNPNGGSLNNLNFILSDEIAHGGGICTDQRFDNGFNNPLPASPGSGTTCGTYYINGVSYNLYNYYAEMCTNNNNQPIAYSGATNPFYGTAGGQASSTNLQVGNSTYPKLYSPIQPGVIQTSYEYLIGVAASSGIDLTIPARQLSNFCSLSSCNLPANLPDNIYVANSDVTLNAYTFPLDKNYVFLIKGNLTINGNILIPTGSDAAFAVTGNIYVNPTVGESSMTSSAANIEGLYTTDQSFIINRDTTSPTCNTDGSPVDLRLNIVGSIVVNAANTGGTFQNNRDFCIDDLTCPIFTTGDEDGNPGGARPGAGNGLTYILNAPQFIMHKNYFFQEVNP